MRNSMRKSVKIYNQLEGGSQRTQLFQESKLTIVKRVYIVEVGWSTKLFSKAFNL